MTEALERRLENKDVKFPYYDILCVKEEMKDKVTWVQLKHKPAPSREADIMQLVRA